MISAPSAVEAKADLTHVLTPSQLLTDFVAKVVLQKLSKF
jgi:hypothetical protein